MLMTTGWNSRLNWFWKTRPQRRVWPAAIVVGHELTKDALQMPLVQRNQVVQALPPNAANDAMHIAVGAVYRMQFLLTWNFSHINNPVTEEQVRAVCRHEDFHCPVICSPDQLLSV